MGRVSAVTVSSRRLVVAAAVLAALLLGIPRRGAAISGTADQSAPTPQATCVFSNPAYSGLCTQQTPLSKGATPAQACESVLSCLNNVDCLKTYCSATTLRGGWKLESAK
jgi:hypothetical protein